MENAERTHPNRKLIFIRENGFLVIENFLRCCEELAEWRRCTDESVEERLGKLSGIYDEPDGCQAVLRTRFYTVPPLVRHPRRDAETGARSETR